MRKIFCDLCGEEIKKSDIEKDDSTFSYLICADCCKKCRINYDKLLDEYVDKFIEE